MPDANQPGVPEPPAITPLPAIRQPLATETAIEAPWRLFLSPNYSGAWAHSTAPVTLDNRTELWHTRLAVRKQQASAFVADESIPRRVRAVWSPDYSPGAIPGHPTPPFPPRRSRWRTHRSACRSTPTIATRSCGCRRISHCRLLGRRPCPIPRSPSQRTSSSLPRWAHGWTSSAIGRSRFP